MKIISLCSHCHKELYASFGEIASSIAQHYNLKNINSLLSYGRYAPLATARKELILALKKAGFSYDEIAFFLRKSRSNIIKAITPSKGRRKEKYKEEEKKASDIAAYSHDY